MSNYDFESALHTHLRKCELDFYKDNHDGAAEITWLAEHCDTVEQIAGYLRELHYKIKRIVDEEPRPGEIHRWVVTTNGLIVYANQDGARGLIARASGK